MFSGEMLLNKVNVVIPFQITRMLFDHQMCLRFSLTLISDSSDMNANKDTFKHLY